jgi:hypothetical protein
MKQVSLEDMRNDDMPVDVIDYEWRMFDADKRHSGAPPVANVLNGYSSYCHRYEPPLGVKSETSEDEDEDQGEGKAVGDKVENAVNEAMVNAASNEQNNDGAGVGDGENEDVLANASAGEQAMVLYQPHPLVGLGLGDLGHNYTAVSAETNGEDSQNVTGPSADTSGDVDQC